MLQTIDERCIVTSNFFYQKKEKEKRKVKLEVPRVGVLRDCLFLHLLIRCYYVTNPW